MFKLMSVDEAAALVKSGDTIAFNGMICMAVPIAFFEALEQRYRKTQSPSHLKCMSTTAYLWANQFAQHPDMVDAIYSGHWRAYNGFTEAVINNKIEAYNIPQGVVALNYRAAAAGLPGFLSRAGLRTSIDPRYGNGAFNEISKTPIAEVQTYNGREYLFYYTIRPDVCVLRGTTVDPLGNITFEREGGIVDALAMAQAAHNNGGTVIVQVERVSDKQANPHEVVVPGPLVDAVYVNENPIMLHGVDYDPLFSGELQLSEEELDKKIREVSAANFKRRTFGDQVIARRAALEIQPGQIVNLGTGVPMLIAMELYMLGRYDHSIAFSIECGATGGIPVGPFAFGANINVGSLISQNQQFDFYEGHGIDITAVGALQIDEKGDVNVSKIGDRIMGVGGFNHVTTSPKKLMICTRIGVRSDLNIIDGKLHLTNGVASKFCEKVENISLASDVSREEGQEVMYITERCVLRMLPKGLEIIEIAPGLDLEKDVLSCFPFRPAISKNLKTMPQECFEISDFIE